MEAGQSWGVILYLVTSLPAGVWFFSWLTTRFSGTSGMESWFSIQLVNLLYLYPSLFLSYFIFHWLIRIRPVNALFTYTTLTHIYPRYHEPRTRLKDLREQDAEQDELG